MAFHLDQVIHVNLAHFLFQFFLHMCRKKWSSSYESVNSAEENLCKQSWFDSPHPHFNSGNQGEAFGSSFLWGETSIIVLNNMVNAFASLKIVDSESI